MSSINRLKIIRHLCCNQILISNNLIKNYININIRKQLIHSSHSLNKIIANNLKNKSKSSQDWLIRQLNDPYVKKARYENYRARSAFKLIEIDDKHNILSPGMIVVECGAAPGAWTQVITKRLKLDEENEHKTGAVIAVDIRPIHPVFGAIMMSNTDFTKPLNQSKILHCLDGKTVDLVCSDMAPNASGDHSYDHQLIISLCYSALQFAVSVLKPMSGVFLTKIWDGSETLNFKNDLNKFFIDVKHLKPDACRGDSSESYILAKNFKGIIR
jgi:23S rRNA (uridine2552-2'-O)-methyltransferase